MRTFVVGTKHSISAYVNDHGLASDKFIPLSSISDARKELSWRNPTVSDTVIITYGFKILPVNQALGIADILIANGFTRNMWRYVA